LVSRWPAYTNDRDRRGWASARKCKDGGGRHPKATSLSRTAPQTALATAGQPRTGATS
jgi:hypothetical protein